jgi:ABC-type dipeptide/oligopeptide/nickel transport system permease component
MSTFIIRRVLITIPLLWFVITVVFISVHLLPGDPVLVMLAGKGSAQDVIRLRHELGLDRSLPVQYWDFLQHVLHLDFGRSVRDGQPVWDEIMMRFPYTVELAASAMLLSTVIGLLTGVLAAVLNRTRLGTAVSIVSVLGISVPDFWLGTMLALVFGVILKVLPVAGTGDWRNLVLPSVTLAIGIGAVLTRLVRSSLVDVLGADYVRTARAKGVGRAPVIFKHALKNALIPVITIYGLIVAYLLGGAVIVENVFAWPGLGTYVVEAVAVRDFPAIQAAVFLFAVILITVNLVVDIAYAFIDPRITIS